VENNSDKAVTVQVKDVSVNGFMVDPAFSSDVLPGKKAFDTISFLESDLQENNITDITTIELTFDIFDSVEFNTIYESENITISF